MQDDRGRQPGEVLDLGVSFQLRHRLAQPLLPNAVTRSGAEHDHDALGTGLQAKREPERLRGIQVDGLADDIRRKRNALQLINWNRDMNDGHAREHAVPELERELERRGRRSDDDADVAPAVFLSQKFRLGGSVGLRGSPLDVEIFREEVDRAPESVGHDAPEYIFDDNGGRLLLAGCYG